MLHAVVIAGGSGTRFWPQSRRALPKQLLTLAGSQTMLQETLARTADWIPAERQWIVTGKGIADRTAEQVPTVGKKRLLAEPVGRNTAPAIGLAAIHLLRDDPDATMLIMPADHVIGPPELFRRGVEAGLEVLKSQADRYLLFGVPPTFASTGYGYIERGKTIAESGSGDRSDDDRPPVHEVRTFREKPDADTATEYLESGRFFWNCGIFLWKAQTVLDGLREHAPNIHSRLVTIADSIGFDPKQFVLKEEFPQMDSISIDYAILENVDRAAVIEAQFDWDDLGSWASLPRLLGKDDNGNTIDAEHVGLDTTNCIIRGRPNHLIATIGLDNCVVVHTEDATYIANSSDENAIKELIRKIEDEGKAKYL